MQNKPSIKVYDVFIYFLVHFHLSTSDMQGFHHQSIKNKNLPINEFIQIFVHDTKP